VYEPSKEMPKEYILSKDVASEKNPLGVKVELEIISLLRLGLISETNILLLVVDHSTQKRRLLKISIYHLREKD
jgi:hypothetical protein